MKQERIERRQYPRSRSGLLIEVDDSDTGVLNHIENISGNGMLCYAEKSIPLMSRMSIAFELPGPTNRHIQCNGVVVRCLPREQDDGHFDVAICFTRLQDEDQEAIKGFVEHNPG